MRLKQRIPVVLKYIDWALFLYTLGIFKTKVVCRAIAKHIKADEERVRRYWLRNPDQRLTQVLTNLNLIPNSSGLWYYLEEVDYLIETQGINPREVLYINSKEGGILLKELQYESLERIISAYKKYAPSWSRSKIGQILIKELAFRKSEQKRDCSRKKSTGRATARKRTAKRILAS